VVVASAGYPIPAATLVTIQTFPFVEGGVLMPTLSLRFLRPEPSTETWGLVPGTLLTPPPSTTGNVWIVTSVAAGIG
jgi:hypothetical protein